MHTRSREAKRKLIKENEMEYMKLKEILLTGGYSDAQFKEIKAIADIRLGNYSAQESAIKELEKIPSDTYAVLFHGRLDAILNTQCDIHILPYNKMKAVTPKVYKNLLHCTNVLYAIAEEWNQDKARTRKFAIGIFHLYCNLVVAYLRDKKIPVSIKTCLQHADKFTGMVDVAFPGYLQSGAISMVVLRETSQL